MSGNKARFRKVVEAIITEERTKKHTILANKLEDVIAPSAKIDSFYGSKPKPCSPKVSRRIYMYPSKVKNYFTERM